MYIFLFCTLEPQISFYVVSITMCLCCNEVLSYHNKIPLELFCIGGLVLKLIVIERFRLHDAVPN